MNQQITDKPTALANLPTDQTVVCQYQGVDLCYALIATAYAAQQPFTLFPGGINRFRPLETGESLFVWNASGTGRIVYNAGA